MSSWIGIDGYVPNRSNDLLQIGVTQQLLTNGEWGCFPWYEWWLKPPLPPSAPVYAQHSVQIMNFTVNPGDTVWASVQYVESPAGQPRSGYLHMGNETTGTSSYGIVLAPPPNADFNGSSVEWIVEAPDGGEGISSLPKFTPVVQCAGLLRRQWHIRSVDRCGHRIFAGHRKCARRRHAAHLEQFRLRFGDDRLHRLIATLRTIRGRLIPPPLSGLPAASRACPKRRRPRPA
jgi:peptidase A4-like protein